MNEETVVGGPASGPQGGPAAADIDEKVFTEAVRRGLITAPQGSAALEEARARGVSLLEVLRAKSLLSEEAAKDLDEETREDFVPGYRILSKLGEGGMGVVYKALQKRLDRVVALKVVMPRLANDPAYLRRFEREAKAVARLNHPNVVAAYDYGESRGRVFLAMEYVEGTNCADWIRENGAMDEDRALAVVRDVAAGLAHAHGAGIIHRDIKPGNLLLASRKPGDTASVVTASGAKVTDLGLARSGSAGGATELTAAGAILGTPGYMAPEQAFGREVDHRADIYALGATLYQLVTGERPFEATTPVAVIARQQTDRLPDPRDLKPALSEGVALLLQGMLSREASTRYPGYRELLADMDRARAGKMPEHPLPPPEHRSVAGPSATPAGGTVMLPPRTPGPATVASAPASAAAASSATPAKPSRAPIVYGVPGVVAAGFLATVLLKNRAPATEPAPPAAPPVEKPEPRDEGAAAAFLLKLTSSLDDVQKAVDAGDQPAAIGMMMDLSAEFEALPSGERKGRAHIRKSLDEATELLARAADQKVLEMWKAGDYDTALQYARWIRGRMDRAAGPSLPLLTKTLESVGERGPAEREAIRAAREARSRNDPLAALAATEGFEKRYEFSPDQKAAKEMREWAEAAAPEIAVESVPPGATVLIAGKEYGRTPTKPFRVAAGDVEFELRLDGHRPLRRTVAVAAGGGAILPFRLQALPPPDPEPAARLIPDGDPRPLWTGVTGAWSTVAGEWSVSNPERKGWIEGEEKAEPAANFKGKYNGLGMARLDLPTPFRSAPGWRLEWQMVGEGRRTGGVVRTELHFAVREGGEAIVVGIDEQDAFLGRRDPASGELVRTHRLSGVEAGFRHSFVVDFHGDVFEAFVDRKRIGAVAAPKDIVAARTVRAAVEGGIGYFSDVFITLLKRP